MLKPILALVLGFVVAVLASAAILRGRSPEPAASSSSAEVPESTQPATDPAFAAAPEAAAGLGSADPERAADPAQALDGQAGESRAAPGAVHGRVLFTAGGAPASGARVTLEIYSDQPRKLVREVSAVLDGTGAFRLAVQGPRDWMIGRLTVRLDGWADATRALEMGSLVRDVDLGDVVLDAGAELRGALRCAGGVPDWRAWRVFVASTDFVVEAWPRSSPSLALASENGEFALKGLSPGEARIGVHHPVLGQVIERALELRPGVNELFLEHAGPDPRRCLVLRVENDKPLPPGSVRLRGAGREWVGEDTLERPNQFLFRDLPEGEYELSIEVRRRKLWSESGIVPGRALRAALPTRNPMVESTADESE